MNDAQTRPGPCWPATALPALLLVGLVAASGATAHAGNSAPVGSDDQVVEMTLSPAAQSLSR